MRISLRRLCFPGSAALRAFESAGRLGSFKRAALETGVSESAVSHQIKRLEKELGVALFLRRHREVVLTPAGRSYLEGVGLAHDHILSATLSLSSKEKADLRISSLPAFAEYCIIPGLADFTRRHPGIGLSILATSDLADLDRDEADIAIRYGDGRWSRYDVELIAAETAQPVISGKTGARIARAARENLGNLPLIINLQHAGEWDPWLPGLESPEKRAVIRLESSSLVLEAVASGAGIGIARRPIADHLLASGAIVPISTNAVTTGKGYYFVTPRRSRGQRPEIAAFRTWLMERTQSRQA
jgi:LysR family glycine cleavage system transcriptional activator